MTWFELTGDERLGMCATDQCYGQPTMRLEAHGVGSNYCSGCHQRITALNVATGNPIVKMPQDTLVSILEAKNAEISKLKADLDEAMALLDGYEEEIAEAAEVIMELFGHAHSGIAPHYSGSFDKAEQHPALVRARAFLRKHQRAE